MTQMELAGVACRLRAIVGSAVLAMAPSSVAMPMAMAMGTNAHKRRAPVRPSSADSGSGIAMDSGIFKDGVRLAADIRVVESVARASANIGKVLLMICIPP